MEFQIKLEDIELCEDDKTLISERLQLNGNGQCSDVFNDVLTKLGKAAFLEYKKMFTGTGMPKHADEVSQERLFLLITYYYRDRIPTEQEVSSIFRLASSTSKTLLRNTLSRYRTQIASQIHNSLVAALKFAEPQTENADRILTIPSDIILDELNAIINQKAPTLDKISRKRKSAGEVECSEDTYNLLRQELGILIDG